MTVRALIDELNRLTKLYDEGHPEVSDKEWDDLYFELVELERNTGEYYEDSPTQRVNYQVVNELNKVEHSHPMLSLDKTKSIDDVKNFIRNKEYIAMAKMDGLTCSLTYENGRLVKAETRGNGLIGEDILHNALVIKNIPKKIKYQNELVVDGEIICTYKNFEQFKEEYKNPRNFASGSIRLLNSEECSNRNLTFVAWDCIKGPHKINEWNEKTKLIKTMLSTQLNCLEMLGFTIVPFRYDIYVNDEAEKRLQYAIDEVKNQCNNLNYPIDGLVFKYNNCYEYDTAGRTDHHFKGGLAYKFYDDEYETRLLDIEWTMGRTGQLTPVAIFEPVDIDGTECSRASLHNISVMEEQLYQPYRNEKIWIYKANQIIPQISNKEWIANEYNPPENTLRIPSTCPICGGETVIKKENNSKVLYCGNPQCQGKLINKLDHFCSKKGLDIKGLSKATLEKLLDWGYIGDIQSIFELNEFREQWIKKPGFGVASVDKILNAIEESKKTSLERVITAAGIPEIGSRVAKDLAEHYNSWTDFRAETDFLQYNGIGEVMNDNLLKFDYTEIDYIAKHYLHNVEKVIRMNEKLNPITSTIAGKIFCITGKVHIFKNRAELQADIESKGGRVVSSISNKVNYLINNDINSTSTKNNKAKELNIDIITEEEYMKGDF